MTIQNIRGEGTVRAETCEERDAGGIVGKTDPLRPGDEESGE